jgi:hypothetical protein
MSNVSRVAWIIARLLLITVNIIGITSIPVARSNIDWGACFLISAIWSIALWAWLTLSSSRFAWLTFGRWSKRIDWSDPYSWDKPFWPMVRYPLRFWFWVSSSFVLGGMVALLKVVVAGRGHEAVAGTFFFTGLFVAITLGVWIRKARSDEQITE